MTTTRTMYRRCTHCHEADLTVASTPLGPLCVECRLDAKRVPQQDTRTVVDEKMVTLSPAALRALAALS